MAVTNADFGASTVAQSRKGNNGPAGLKTRETTELAGRKEMTNRHDEREL